MDKKGSKGIENNQEIEIDYNERPVYEPIEEGTERRAKSEQPLGDVYDVYGMVSRVHSQQTSMTRDYTLAQYTSEVINAKFPKFVREQRKTLRVVKSFMLVSEERLAKRYNEKYAKKCIKVLQKIYDDIEELLLGEIDEMVIISRAGKGEVTKAMLLHSRTKEEREEYEQNLGGNGMKDKLMEKSK